MNKEVLRRHFLQFGLGLTITGLLVGCGLTAIAADAPPPGFRSLFDGKTLAGWHAVPRAQGAPSAKKAKSDKGNANSFYERSLQSRGKWTVEDGVIIGGQEPSGSGFGAYLVSDETFGDFELLIDARPDWRVDTGVLVRTIPQGNVGFQVLLDHRPHGGIGGFYGNGLWNFHAWNYGFTGETDKDGRLLRLIPSEPVEPVKGNNRVPLDYCAPAEVFLRIWKLNDWNTFRIRSEGAVPHLTTWINGEKIAELDTAKMQSPGWNPKAMLEKLGRTGHIALEVHSNGPEDKLGQDRWAPGAVCRWRNIFIKPLQDSLPSPWKAQDIGAVQTPGKADYNSGVFTLHGTLDIWNKADGCQLMWQPVHGDAELVACVMAIDNPGQVGHAKASLCIRESLDPGAKSVTMCVTPVDGTQFLYRDQTGGETIRIFPDAAVQKKAVPKGKFPCWLKLIRRGNQFSGFESTDGKTWQLAAQIDLDLSADAIIGLAASSHTKDTLTKATFEHVQLGKPSAVMSSNANNRVAQLTTMAIDGTEKRVILQSQNIEAPNWSPDGKWLVFNGRGSLWRFPTRGGKPPEQISMGSLKGVNNDHVISPDGKTIYVSAFDGHLYAVPFEGGQPRRISNDQDPQRKFKYYLHGVSPDGKMLAYVGAELVGNNTHGRLNLYTIPTAGGQDTRLTSHPQFDDGPEYSPDGKWIYFNSELNAKVPGHAQCYRMRPDGSEQADLIHFNGGQGTINVNSWSPDSKHFAFVMYPEAAQ